MAKLHARGGPGVPVPTDPGPFEADQVDALEPLEPVVVDEHGDDAAAVAGDAPAPADPPVADPPAVAAPAPVPAPAAGKRKRS